MKTKISKLPLIIGGVAMAVVIAGTGIVISHSSKTAPKAIVSENKPISSEYVASTATNETDNSNETDNTTSENNVLLAENDDIENETALADTETEIINEDIAADTAHENIYTEAEIPSDTPAQAVQETPAGESSLPDVPGIIFHPPGWVSDWVCPDPAAHGGEWSFCQDDYTHNECIASWNEWLAKPCIFCGKADCPNKDTTDCPEYLPINDGNLYCLTCHRPLGDGHNGTCRPYIGDDWYLHCQYDY